MGNRARAIFALLVMTAGVVTTPCGRAHAQSGVLLTLLLDVGGTGNGG